MVRHTGHFGVEFLGRFGHHFQRGAAERNIDVNAAVVDCLVEQPDAALGWRQANQPLFDLPFDLNVLLAVFVKAGQFFTVVPPSDLAVLDLPWPRHLQHDALADLILFFLDTDRRSGVFKRAWQRHGHRFGHHAAELLKFRLRPAISWRQDVAPAQPLKLRVPRGEFATAFDVLADLTRAGRSWGPQFYRTIIEGVCGAPDVGRRVFHVDMGTCLAQIDCRACFKVNVKDGHAR